MTIISWKCHLNRDDDDDDDDDEARDFWDVFPQHSPSYGAHSAEDQEHTMVRWKSPTPKNRHHEPQNDGCTDLEMRLGRWQSHKPPMFPWLPTIKIVKQGIVYYCFTNSTMAVTLLQTFASMRKFMHHECRSFSERGSVVVFPQGGSSSKIFRGWLKHPGNN